MNQEINEETATALCITINNHIEALRAWERKLKQPFTPQPSHFRTTHAAHAPPTLQTGLHLCMEGTKFRDEVARILLPTARQMMQARKETLG